VDYTLPTLLIMGAENSGVSNEYLKISNVKAKLPMLGQVESLNVSVAAGIFMYEVLRQRGIQ
jgi:23S rRNA (guanosine2251-2'-O)-methyltransferase